MFEAEDRNGTLLRRPARSYFCTRSDRALVDDGFCPGGCGNFGAPPTCFGDNCVDEIEAGLPNAFFNCNEDCQGDSCSIDWSLRNLSSLPENFGMLRCRGKIRSISLSDNVLTTLPTSITRLTSLTELVLDNNNLRILPASFGALKSLRRFSANSNSLTQLPSEFGKLNNLQWCDIENNLIAELPSFSASLTSLLASNNRIKTIPSQNGLFEFVTTLKFAGNLLEELPPARMKLLRYLDVSRNRLRSIPASFLNELPFLGALVVAGNALTSLPALDGIPKLRMLDFSNNALDLFPKSVTALTLLESIFASGNFLTRLPDDLGRLNQLRLLDLSYNRLTTVPKAVSAFGEKVGGIRMRIDLRFNLLEGSIPVLLLLKYHQLQLLPQRCAADQVRDAAFVEDSRGDFGMCVNATRSPSEAPTRLPTTFNPTTSTPTNVPTTIAPTAIPTTSPTTQAPTRTPSVTTAFFHLGSNDTTVVARYKVTVTPLTESPVALTALLLPGRPHNLSFSLSHLWTHPPAPHLCTLGSIESILVLFYRCPSQPFRSAGLLEQNIQWKRSSGPELLPSPFSNALGVRNACSLGFDSNPNILIPEVN